MKKNKLKPFLTGSVFILPALLLLTGTGQETKAMMKGAVGKVLGNIKSNPIKIPNITGGVKVSSGALNNIKKNATSSATITKPITNNTSSTSSSLGLGNLKQNKFTVPSLTGSITVSSGSITSAVKKAGLTGVTTTTGNKSSTLPTNTSTSTSSPSNLVNKSNSFSGTTVTKRPAPQPPTSSNKSTSSNREVVFEKLNPGYDTVPKPIFTPKKSGTTVNTNNETYENVVIVNTAAGTLTIFKDN